MKSFVYDLGDDCTVAIANEVVEQLDIVQLNAKVEDGLLYIDYKDDTTISDAFLIGVIVESIVNQTFNQHESKN